LIFLQIVTSVESREKKITPKDTFPSILDLKYNGEEIPEHIVLLCST